MEEELKESKIKVINYEKVLMQLQEQLNLKTKIINDDEIKIFSLNKEKHNAISQIEEIKKVLIQAQNFDDLKNMIEIILKEQKSSQILEDYFSIIEKQKKEIIEFESKNQNLQNELEELLDSTKNEHKLLIDKTIVNVELSKTIKILEKEIEEIKNKLNCTNIKENIVEKMIDSAKIYNDNEKKIETEEDEDEEENEENKFKEEIQKYETDFEIKNKEKEKILRLTLGNIKEKLELKKQMNQGYAIMQKV